ncbi:hypothetical protein FOVG_18730 [Fusarium oxysporum f. sp. pisi HDV247]|uniref:Uncharacterized protein n=1 Tax=Fusarium oxysporum f. sp. pisi HDV247 TaxID=1080344 RepID=W9NII1_FUSOX|nr:hypothetical protein FOVG_18730 [Fusarium oxysporum f. sp. pisi HDV247]
MLKRLKACFSLAAHITLAIVLIAVGTTLLNDSKNEKEGIFKVELGRNLLHRGLSIPTENIPSQATEVVKGADGVAKQATVAVAQATHVVQDIQSKVTSAIAAGETLLNKLVPEALAVGTTTGCVEYGDGHSDCVSFPLGDDKTFNIISNLSNEAGSLVNQLHRLPSLKSLFIAGLVCFAISCAYAVVNAVVMILPIASNGLPLKNLICIILSICTCGIFTCFMTLVIIIWLSGRGLAELPKASFHSGTAFWVSIVALVSSASHFVCVVLEKFLGA